MPLVYATKIRKYPERQVGGSYQEHCMSKETLAAEKAEFIQSVQALFIPLGLFLACVIMAAGTSSFTTMSLSVGSSLESAAPPW